MTQSLAQLQAEWLAVSQRTDADHQYAGHARKFAKQLQPHVEREAADLELMRRVLTEMSWALNPKVGGPVQAGWLFEKYRDELRARLKETAK